MTEGIHHFSKAAGDMGSRSAAKRWAGHIKQEPWKALGISKSTYHRRKKKEDGGRLVRTDQERLLGKKLHVLRMNARARGIKCTITVADFPDGVPSACPVLGIEMAWESPRLLRPSFDRVDNSKGYIAGNVVIISGMANLIKGRWTSCELRRTADYIDSRLGSTAWLRG